MSNVVLSRICPWLRCCIKQQESSTNERTREREWQKESLERESPPPPTISQEGTVVAGKARLNKTMLKNMYCTVKLKCIDLCHVQLNTSRKIKHLFILVFSFFSSLYRFLICLVGNVKGSVLYSTHTVRTVVGVEGKIVRKEIKEGSF